MTTKTTTLICEHCNHPFERRTAEYNYQRQKYPNRKMFCTPSCSTSFYNKMSPTGNKNQNPSLVPMPGNKFGQRYPDGMGYYVTRCAKDGRFSSFCTQEDRANFGEHIFELWGVQQHKCAVTGATLTLRDSRGRCATTNPFNIASLDRIDCGKPYEPGNVQWVSYAINLARNNLSLDTFNVHVQEFLCEVNNH